MKIIKAIWSRITDALGRDEPLVQRLAHPIDSDRLARRLAVAPSARLAAQHNQPASDELQPDANEQRIAQHFRAWLGRISQEVNSAYTSALSRCDALQELFSSSRLQSIEATAAEALERLKVRSHGPLAEARRREREARRELASFRSAHHLEREPRPAIPLRHMAVAAVITVIVEGMINAWAFAEGSDFGTLGGLYLAMICSGINLGVALGAGVAARNLFHLRWQVKALGWLTTGLYAAFLGAYTLLCAHYRVALVNRWEDPGTQAALRVLEVPFQLHDFNTLLLVICSLSFAIAAFASGLLSADLVPGYSRVYGRWALRHTRVQALRAAYQGNIDTVTEPMLAMVANRVREGRSARAEFAHNATVARQLIADYGHFARRLEVAFVDLVRHYRKVNTEVRDTPAPGYFNSTPSPFDVGKGLSSDSERQQHHEALIARFPEEADDFSTLAVATESRIRALRGLARAKTEDFFATADGGEMATVVSHVSAMAPYRLPRVNVREKAVPVRGNGADDGDHPMH